MIAVLPGLFLIGQLLVGLFIGGQVNRAIYGWTQRPRAISPWSRQPANVASRCWADCIPVVGWWAMRRESNVHGSLFWLRPMLIELACGAGLPALYWWEVTQHDWPTASFCSHVVLFVLLIIATFTDLDDGTIPDVVTIPGSIAGLLFAAFAPNSLLPAGTMVGVTSSESLLATAPAYDWPVWLNESPGLRIGLFCWLGWCFALLPRTVYFERGVTKGFQFLLVSIVRHPLSKLIGSLSILGTLAILTVGAEWASSGNVETKLQWQALLTSLVGLGFAGGLGWSIRMVLRGICRSETMGFGDVTLMAMIGAFIGWQAALLAFLITPFVSAVFSTILFLITGHRYSQKGPPLSASTAIVVLGWTILWGLCGPFFKLGYVIPLLVAVVFSVGVTLAALQILKPSHGIRRR